MLVEQALEKYSNAVARLKEHQTDNQAVFDAHKLLLNGVIDAENELRDQVAEAKLSANNEFFDVSYTPQTQTFADIEMIDQLIAAGKIAASLRGEIVKTQDRPARITIHERKQ